MSLRRYQTLVRRELWENRSLWLAPVVAAVALVGAVIGVQIFGDGGSITINPGPLQLDNASQRAGAASLLGTFTVLSMAGGFAVFAYLLDCLFAERKDRSILFWKSLPVSDAETVLTKLFVALVLVPTGTILLTLALQPVLGLIVYLGAESLRPAMGLDVFASWPAILPRIGIIWVFSTLWYAPLACYLMLASVLAPRTPMVYAVVPPAVLLVLERVTLSTSHLGQFLLARLVPGTKVGRDLLLSNGSSTHSLGEWLQPFMLPDLWLGLAVAAGMLYIVIRLRRFRDDT